MDRTESSELWTASHATEAQDSSTRATAVTLRSYTECRRIESMRVQTASCRVRHCTPRRTMDEEADCRKREAKAGGCLNLLGYCCLT